MKRFCKRCDAPAPHSKEAVIANYNGAEQWVWLWRCDCCKTETPARKPYNTKKRRYIAALAKEFGIN